MGRWGVSGWGCAGMELCGDGVVWTCVDVCVGIGWCGHCVMWRWGDARMW